MSLIGFFLHWFTPQHGNAHRPKVLHHKSLLYIIAIFLIAQGGIVALTRVAPQILGFASNIPPDKIVDLTNTQRVQRGLSPLHLNNELTQAALSKAAYMFAKDYWAHVAPDGTQPWFFITQSGYHYLHAGENLARDFTNPESVVSAWMDSATHKENLLNPNYNDIGVAVVDGTLGGVQTTLVVQMFGARTSSAPSAPKVAANTASSPSPSPKITPKVTPKVPEITPQATTTLTPSPIATPQIAAIIQSPQASPLPSIRPLFSPYSATKMLTSTVVTIVIIALAFDMVLVWKRRIVRLTGRSWAHISYLAAMLLALLIIRGGNIL